MVDALPSEYPVERLRQLRDQRVRDINHGRPSASPRTERSSAKGNRLTQALEIWKLERRNKSEGFWQTLFSDRPELLGTFELFRKSLSDVVILTYDELFEGIKNLAVWMMPPE